MTADNIKKVKERMASAAARAGRNPQDIVLVCVSKSAGIIQIKEAVNCGIRDFGENRVQDALKKFEIIGREVKWHMIGHLQTNKVKKALEIFELIHSVDSLHLAEAINYESNRKGKISDILLEVNTSAEKTKFGFGLEKIVENIVKIAQLANIKIKGLMTIAPIASDPQQARPYFRKLFELKEKILKEKIKNADMQYLSMGMTQDFEVAIEEGANMVRIGTAIFNERMQTDCCGCRG